MNIGTIIKKYRKEQGISMERFAGLCGCSKGYISMLEKGVNPVNGKPIKPGIKLFARIASVMHLSVDDLLSMTESEYPEMTQAPLIVGEPLESISAYYDGYAFVPITPVAIRKNQPVIVTVLDEKTMTPSDRARQAASQLKGILIGSGMSSEAFSARKQVEKELEK